jgi:O-antigen ligase
MTALLSIVIFLIYVNAPAVLVREFSLPVLIAALVPMVLVIIVAYRVVVRGEALRFPGLILAALLMLACHAASALLSTRPDLGMNSVFEWLLEGVFLAFLVVNCLRTREEVFSAVRAIVAAGAVMGLLVILQQLLGPCDFDMGGYLAVGSQCLNGAENVQHRLSGPIGEENFFGQIMAVLIPAAAGLAIAARGPQRWLYWTATLLIFGGMALTYSRGTMVAVVLVVPFALLFGFLRLRQLAVIALCSVLLITASPYLAKRVTSIGQAAIQTLGLSAGGFRNSDGALRGRATEMQAAALMFLDNPLVGVGPGMAREYYPEYALLVGGKVRADNRRTHSLYLQLASETGLVGLLAFLGTMAMVLLPLDRARRRLRYGSRDHQFWALVCGLELTILVLLSTSLFLHASYIRYFWLLLALAVAAASLLGRETMTNFQTLVPRNVPGRIGTLA